MKSIIDRIFSTRTLALLLALCATTSAWADTLRVLGDDVAIHSNATDSNRSGYNITTGSLSFNTPSGCSAGDSLLFTKLQMINEGTSNNRTYAQTITITVGDKTYTSGNVVTSTESLGNLGSKSVLTYNFPNVPVQAGSSYSITFNNAGSAGIRYGVENTNTYTGYTISLTGSSDNWHPYGAITATKVLSSSPDVGDTILLSNTATSGAADSSATSKDFFSLSIPTDLGLPNGSVVKVTKVNLAGRNNSYSSNQDPYGIYVNGVRSLNLRGTTTYANSETTAFSLNTATIMVDGTTSVPRLSYAFGSDCNLTVGTSYDAATTGNYSTSGKGVSLLHANGTPIISGGKEVAAVRHVSASSGVIVNGNVSGYYPVYEMYAEVVSIPTETATISAAGTYTLTDLFTSVSSGGRYTINVNESATLNIDAATTVSAFTLNVASGKTLTVTGSALTVDNGLRVTGEGYVNLTDATVSGTLKGDGTVVYTGTATPSGLVFTDTAWEGTLWLENKTDVTAWEPTSYGSANSTIRMTGIQLYFNTYDHRAANVTFDGTLEVTDTYSNGTAAGYGIEINNGWSDATTTFGALKGTGTIKDTDQSATPLLAFNDASEFAGTINLSYNKKIRIGTSGDVWAGEVYIAAGKSATVAPGKTWTSNGGFYVLGTLTLGGTGSTLSGDVNGSGTVVCNQVDLSGSGFDSSANYGWTGKVQIAGDTVSPATYFDEATYGNADSTLEIVSGHVAITEATSLPGTVNVANGATLYMTSSSLTALAISGTNSGTINLQMAGSLTTLTLSDGIARGTVVYPDTLTTLNVALTETIADDGRASFTCGRASPTSGTLTLTRPDGTTENIAGTVEGATISFAWMPAVSGPAAWCAYEFASNLNNSGDDNTALSADGTFSATTSVDGDGKLYTYSHPYRNITYPADGNWSAMVRCTVPKLAEAIVVTFGTRAGGLIGLAAGATPDSEMYLVQTTNGGGSYDSHYVTNAVMPVLNGTTAQHVYVFTVASNQTVKIYCDNSLIETKVIDSPFTIGGGIQIGAIHGGMGNVGLHGCRSDGTAADPAYSALSEADQKAARVDSMRLYKGVLGPNAIAQLSEEFPAVKLFEATISGGDANAWGSLAWTGGDISTINAYSKAIVTVEDDATLTLPASITADELVFNIASGKMLTLVDADGGTTLNIGHPIEVETGSVAFDASSKTIDFAIGGTGYVFVDTGKTISVASGGSLSRVSGSGMVTYASYGSLPSALAFGDWTGTVVLPSFAADGLNLNNYGKSGSTVELLGITGGWIAQAGTTVAPTLKLSGNMVIDAMSSWTYTFAKIDGTGNLSFSTSANSPTVNITEVASTYSGSISSTLSNPVTIATLVRPGDQVMTGGTKLLTTSGDVRVNALTLGNTPNAYVPVTLNDGIYVKYGSSTLNGTVTYYDTAEAAIETLAAPSVNHNTVVTILDPSFVAANYPYASMLPSMGILWNETSRSYSFAAVTDRDTNYETIAAAIEGGVTAISLNRSVTEDVTLPVGTTITLGSYTLTGTVTSGTDVNGYELTYFEDTKTWAVVDNRTSTWTGAANDGSWTTGSNWSAGIKPSQYTTVTFPSEGAPWTVDIPNDNGNAKCAAMVIDGNTTVAYTGSSWASLWLYGGVTGSGVLTLDECGLSNKSGAALTIATPVVSTASDNCYLAGGAFTFSDSVTVSAGQLKAEYTSATFGGTVTINNSANVKANGSGSSLTFNGGIDVPANASASLQVSSGAITITSTVTLASGATLTIPNSAVVSGATFVTAESGKAVVASTGDTTTVYAAQVVPIDNDSEDEVGYMDNTTAVITNTTGPVTIPEGATAVAVSFSTGDEITLTSESLNLATSGVTVYATDASGAKTATDITAAFKVTAGANSTYKVELNDNAIVGGVSVTPEVDTAAETAPMAFDSTAPVFTIKTIPGLWYTVASGATLESLTNGTPQQADELSETLTAPDFTGTVQYYKVTVAPSKAALQ